MLNIIESPALKFGAGVNVKEIAAVVVGIGSPAAVVNLALVEDSIIPPLLDLDIAIVGATSGDFLINVMWSSIKLPPLICVCVKTLLLAFLNLEMFIFFGSVKLSVQNIKPSNMFIPVIKFVFVNFKTFCVSTRIGFISFVS